MLNINLIFGVLEMRTRIRRSSISKKIHDSSGRVEQKLLEDINNKLGAIVILLTQLKEGN